MRDAKWAILTLALASCAQQRFALAPVGSVSAARAEGPAIAVRVEDEWLAGWLALADDADPHGGFVLHLRSAVDEPLLLAWDEARLEGEDHRALPFVSATPPAATLGPRAHLTVIIPPTIDVAPSGPVVLSLPASRGSASRTFYFRARLVAISR